MKLCSNLWNLLHDGTIVGVAGAVPGTVTLRIACDHLRGRFSEPGDRFLLTLNDCDRFEFQSWADDAALVSGLEAIASLGIEILGADEIAGHFKIHCNRRAVAIGGDLYVAAQHAELRLDSGRLVALGELDRVSAFYWAEWSSRKPV